MLSQLPRPLQEVEFERYAQAYLRSLEPEDHMESTDQATQRLVTTASLQLLTLRRPEVSVFSELLVQYPLEGQRRPGQVVPDNMVVLGAPARKRTSYNLPLEPARPLGVLEYVSQESRCPTTWSSTPRRRTRRRRRSGRSICSSI